MLNVVELVNYLRAHPDQTTYIVDQLWIDFYNKVSYEKGGIILGQPHLFVDSVNQTLKHMDTIYNSVKNANGNYIWAVLFNRIRNIALNYYVFIVDKKFLNLEFRYSPNRIEVSEVKNEALTFMGLKAKFTREELMSSYRRLVLKYHPDKGGKVEDFRKLQVYKEQLERNL